MDKVREEFESAYIRDMVGNSTEPACVWLERGSDGEYRSYQARGAWWGWKASRECLLVELPEKVFFPDGRGDEYEAIDADDLIEAIHAAGVRTK